MCISTSLYSSTHELGRIKAATFGIVFAEGDLESWLVDRNYFFKMSWFSHNFLFLHAKILLNNFY